MPSDVAAEMRQEVCRNGEVPRTGGRQDSERDFLICPGLPPDRCVGLVVLRFHALAREQPTALLAAKPIVSLGMLPHSHEHRRAVAPTPGAESLNSHIRVLLRHA